jgi:hypothetical protein
VYWRASKFKGGVWILSVVPPLPSLWTFLRGRKPAVYTDELQLISREIHSLLASVTGLSNIYWYFAEFRREGMTGVWTPDDLPWPDI